MCVYVCRPLLWQLGHCSLPILRKFSPIMSSNIFFFRLFLFLFFWDPYNLKIQFSRSVMSDSLRPHESQHARPPCPSPTPEIHPGSHPSSQMPSSHLILCRPLLLLPPIPPSISVFSNELTLHMRWLKYWSFSFSIIPSKEIPRLISFRMDWLDPLAVQGTLKSLLQHHSSKASSLWRSAFFTVQLSHPYMTTGKTIALTRRTFVGKVMSAFEYAIEVGHNLPSKE